MTTEILKALEQHAESLAELRSRIAMQETLQGQNVAMIETLETRLDTQAIVVARRGEQIEKLQSVNASQSDRIDTANTQADELLERIDAADTYLHNLAINQRNRSDKLHDQICTINERLAIHVTRLDASASMHESAGMMRDMDHDRIERQAGTLCRVDEKLNDTEQRIGDVEFQLEGKVDDLDKDHADRLLALESELEDTTRTANSAEMDVNDCKMDVSSLESSVDSLKSDLSSLSHTVNYG